jgi:RNA polymerase sigma factor FliA
VVQASDSTEVLDRFHGALDLVSAIAGQMRASVGSLAQREDLLSYGRMGLLDAARRFDGSKGVPFRAYAAIRIRGSMIDGIRALAPLSRRTHERLRGLAAIDRVNEGMIDDAYSPGALAVTAEAADQALAEHLASLATAMALGMVATPVRGQEDAPTALSSEQSPEDAASDAEMRETVRRALGTLPHKEAELVRRHYLDGERFDEVAAELGLSKSWASRLHSKALSRLSKRLRAAGIEP